MKNLIWTVGLSAVIVVFLVVWGGIATKPAMTVADPTILAAISTSTAPWPIEIAHLRDRLAADGLPALAAEGTVLHIHQHLDIFIDGKQVPVPPEIGINDGAGFISPIHVHDDTGIIHVESPTVQTFTLGQFFDVWGVEFTGQSIGGYAADAQSGKKLQIFVNGTLYQGDPRTLALAAHQEIAVVYGTDKEMPKTIPSSFTFPEGY
jgi:hypothetical protein